MEVQIEVLNLRQALQARKDEAFVGIEAKRILNKLEKDGDVTKQQAQEFVARTLSFYDTCIGYIDRWDHSEDVRKLSFVLLRKTPSWSEVEAASEMITSIIATGSSSSDGNNLFDQTACVIKYVTADVLDEWRKQARETGQRWVEVFEHFARQQIAFGEILHVVQFALALPGTNAPIERVFSLMNDMWSDDKTQLQADTVKNMLIAKVNFDIPCLDFHTLIKSNRASLERS
jgi:hypothetical protein